MVNGQEFALDQSKKESVEPDENIDRRWLFGGDFYGQFGTYSNLKVAPMVAYRITHRLMAGSGFTYIYLSDKSVNQHYQSHIYGGSVFTRFTLIESFEELIGINFAGQVFAHSEYEGMSLERRYFDVRNQFPSSGRFWQSSIWLGGGLSFPLGQSSGMYFSVLWNVLQNENSLYASPLIRLGFLI